MRGVRKIRALLLRESLGKRKRERAQLREEEPTVFSPIKNELTSSVDDTKMSIFDIPTEIRMEIWSYLLDLNNIPTSYGYTASRLAPSAKPTMLKHGMLIVSKYLSAEYRQAFYERTTFFLRINSSNAMIGVPELSHAAQDASPTTHAEVPNFWNAPDALLANLRHCTLYIELGSIASDKRARHSVSRVVRSNTSLTSAHLVRMEMMTYSSLDELKSQDTVFDTLLQSSVLGLLHCMKQLRSVRVVWDTTVEGKHHSSRFLINLSTNWTWNVFGTPLVEELQKKPNMQSFEVKVGDKDHDVTHKAKRGERGRWSADQQTYYSRPS